MDEYLKLSNSVRTLEDKYHNLTAKKHKYILQRLKSAYENVTLQNAEMARELEDMRVHIEKETKSFEDEYNLLMGENARIIEEMEEIQKTNDELIIQMERLKIHNNAGKEDKKYEKLLKEKKILEASIKDLNGRIADLEKENSTLKHSNSELLMGEEKKEKNLLFENINLQSKLNELENKYNCIFEENKALKEKLITVEKAGNKESGRNANIKMYKEMINKLEENINIKNKHIEDLEGKVCNRKGEESVYSELSAKIDDICKKFIEQYNVTLSISDVTNKINFVINDINSRTSSIDKLMKEEINRIDNMATVLKEMSEKEKLHYSYDLDRNIAEKENINSNNYKKDEFPRNPVKTSKITTYENKYGKKADNDDGQYNIKDNTIKMLKETIKVKDKMIKKQKDMVETLKTKENHKSLDENIIFPEAVDSYIIFDDKPPVIRKPRQKRFNEEKPKTNNLDDLVISKNKKITKGNSAGLYIQNDSQKLTNNSFFADLTFTDSSPVIKKNKYKK